MTTKTLKTEEEYITLSENLVESIIDSVNHHRDMVNRELLQEFNRSYHRFYICNTVPQCTKEHIQYCAGADIDLAIQYIGWYTKLYDIRDRDTYFPTSNIQPYQGAYLGLRSGDVIIDDVYDFHIVES